MSSFFSFSAWEQLVADDPSAITAADCVSAARLYRYRANINAACNAFTRGLNLQCAALEIIIGLLEVRAFAVRTCARSLAHLLSSVWQTSHLCIIHHSTIGDANF
jgi:hypothetical protein